MEIDDLSEDLQQAHILHFALDWQQQHNKESSIMIHQAKPNKRELPLASTYSSQAFIAPHSGLLYVVIKTKRHVTLRSTMHRACLKTENEASSSRHTSSHQSRADLLRQQVTFFPRCSHPLDCCGQSNGGYLLEALLQWGHSSRGNNGGDGSLVTRLQ